MPIGRQLDLVPYFSRLFARQDRIDWSVVEVMWLVARDQHIFLRAVLYSRLIRSSIRLDFFFEHRYALCTISVTPTLTVCNHYCWSRQPFCCYLHCCFRLLISALVRKRARGHSKVASIQLLCRLSWPLSPVTGCALHLRESFDCSLVGAGFDRWWPRTTR